ncbi:MAG: hypothetical protein HKP09_03640 [Enterobacterales bacterium]|nr:hypothetical protein [Enterobacterales bacterium]
MLAGKSLIFVHHPRTAGTSVRNLLMRAVPDNYFPMQDPNLSQEQKVWITHQGLGVCYDYCHRIGINPIKVPTLVCIRNPYSLMLSEYMYLSQKWKKKIKDLEKTLGAYLANMYRKSSDERKQKWAADTYGRFHDFITINGQIPENLTIARFETLEEDVRNFLQNRLEIADVPKLPRKNASRHGDVKNYYTDKEEKLVYAMFKNVFESGLYKRYEGLE